MTRKTAFFEELLWFKFNNLGLALGTNLKCYTILHQCGKTVKTKTQKVLGANSYVCRSYRGKTGKGTFLPPPSILKKVKVNKENYCKEWKKSVKHNDWIFVQGSSPSHRSNLVQYFLEKTLKRHFVKCVEWLPSSPDANPLDYFFWDIVGTKVY